MSDLKFEKVFSVTTPTAPQNVIQDGRYVLVCGAGNKLYVYEWIGETAGHDFDLTQYDELTYYKLGNILTLTLTLTLSHPACHIFRSYSRVWVTNGFGTWTKMTRINAATGGIDYVVDAPETMISNICVENGKLWCVGQGPQSQTGSDTNKLWIFTPSSNGGTWASVSIPVKKQLASAEVTSGYNGYVYVTNFNNLSVSRFDSTTGAFDTTLRVNAFPNRACTATDRGIFIVSYGSVLSKIDGLTNEVFNAHAVVGTATQIVPQGTDYVWFVADGKVGRVSRADNEVKLFPDDASWTIGTPSRIAVSLPFKYKQFDGTNWSEINAVPHLFVIDESKLHMIKLDNYLMVEHTLTLQSHSMVSTGTNDYMGEVG